MRVQIYKVSTHKGSWWCIKYTHYPYNEYAPTFKSALKLASQKIRLLSELD